MNAPKMPKSISVAQYAIAAGVFVGGIIAGLVVSLKTNSSARPDPWTGTQHSQYAQLVDERIEHVSGQIAELAKLVHAHVAMDMHHGARVQFTEITGELRHIGAQLDKIQSRLDGG